MKSLLFYTLIAFISIQSTSTTQIQFKPYITNSYKNLQMINLTSPLLQGVKLISNYNILPNKTQTLVNSSLFIPFLLYPSKELNCSFEDAIQDEVLLADLQPDHQLIIPYSIFKCTNTSIQFIKHYEKYKDYKYYLYPLSTFISELINPILLFKPIKIQNLSITGKLNSNIIREIHTYSFNLFLSINKYKGLLEVGYNRNIINNKKQIFSKIKLLNIVQILEIANINIAFKYQQSNIFRIIPELVFPIGIFKLGAGLEYTYNKSHFFNFKLILGFNNTSAYINDIIEDNVTNNNYKKYKTKHKNFKKPNKHILKHPNRNQYTISPSPKKINQKNSQHSISIRNLNEIPINLK